jgi:hypothetical protein
MVASVGCGLELGSDSAQEREASEKAEQQLYAASSLIWNNRTISVCWENPGGAFAQEKAWTMAALRRTWEAESQIHFTFTDCGSANIRINWSDEGPHTHGLGTILDNMVNGMTLNPTFNNWGQDCAQNEQERQTCIETIAVHEFGHALGFAHEQNRPDTPATCANARQGSNGDYVVGAWDLSSIMNYCNPKWANGGELSATDITGVRTFYGNRKRADWVTRVMIAPGNFGGWSPVAFCPDRTWASGYKMRIESSQGRGDDTALNAVSMACTALDGGGTSSITPHSGLWGDWRGSASCPVGTAIRAGNMLVEGIQGGGDDTGANDVHFQCTNGSLLQATDGIQNGSWQGWNSCPVGTAVCGAIARTESSQGGGDDTAMNGLQVDCCAYPSYTCDIDFETNRTTCSGDVSVSMADGRARTEIDASRVLAAGGSAAVSFEVRVCQPTGWVLDIGDSPSNNGGGGDDGDFSNDAELQLFDSTFTAVGRDGTVPAVIMSMPLRLLDSSHGNCWTETITVRDQVVSLRGNDTADMTSPGLIRFNAPDSEGTPDSWIFAGFNRVIDDWSTSRVGSGVRQVRITVGAK